MEQIGKMGSGNIKGRDSTKRRLSMRQIMLVFGLLFLVTVGVDIVVGNGANGRIAGKLVDSETGDPMIGANVFLEGTMIGAASDLDGNYMISKVPPGEYILIISVIGYAKKTITAVQVSTGELTKLDVALEPEALAVEDVVVTAKMIRSTESALLKDRQRAIAVSDAISAEAISRTGSGDAADAMKQVTGASVVDGKYVFVRGLGDRYTSTQLNGVEIPSTNPYKRAGSIDLIPSSLVDNIVTVKSFTPDKPGNFSGGTVDIHTKDFPEKLNITFSTSTSYNSQTTFRNDGPIGYRGSSTDWLGYDSGIRNIPALLQNLSADEIPDRGTAQGNLQAAKFLDGITKAFNNDVMSPEQETPPVNQSYSFSLGNQMLLFGKPLGFLASLSYSNSYASYDNGSWNRWELGVPDTVTNVLKSRAQLADTKSSREVLWGGLLKSSYMVSPLHRIGVNFLYNQNGVSESRFLDGFYDYDLGPTDVWQARSIGYNERRLFSGQLNGDHHLKSLLNARIDWRAAFTNAKQDEPDLRFFNSAELRDANLNTQGYTIRANQAPSRYFRFMDESSHEGAIDLAVPFKQWTGLKSDFKVGALISDKHRDFSERLFTYRQGSRFNYNGNVRAFFSQSNLGLVDSTIQEINGRVFRSYQLGLTITENSLPASTYEGDQSIFANYAMVDLPVFDKLRFIGGARYETTKIDVITADTTLQKGQINTKDVLPSINFILALRENMNIRASYGRTLARPTFREVAPYATFDINGGDTYVGNPGLKRTIIDNYDLRWEWFSRPGEIYATSAFYKSFTNPIESVFINNNFVKSWQNVDRATVYGLEFEARKQLDILAEQLSNFAISGNLSLVKSKIDIPRDDLVKIRQTRTQASGTRELAGQSPYIVNLNLLYNNEEHGIAATLYYNVFGKRLADVNGTGAPDIFEHSFDLLNFTFSWKFARNINLKFGAKNLLNSKVSKTQEFKGTDYTVTQYQRGTSVSVGLGYSL